MSTLSYLSRRLAVRPARGLVLAAAGAMLWTLGTTPAAATGVDAPADLAPLPVVPAAPAPLLRADDIDDVQRSELERQQRLREIRRQLREYGRTWRGDAGIRRSAAMPEPTDTPAVVADKILPLAPAPVIDPTVSPGAKSALGLPLIPSGTARLPQALPDVVPQVMDAQIAPELPALKPQGSAAAQTAGNPLKAGKMADAVTGPDPRLTERERTLLRQQLRQMLRLQEPRGNQ